ncbi:hypothetical protein FRC02_010936 [Tulasnella sp. 418]|nr:hypothetical protein FRC02_010936 [Tulasnella sp. 418]
MDAPTGEFVDHRLGYTNLNGGSHPHPHQMLQQPVPQLAGQRYTDSYSTSYYPNQQSVTASPGAAHPDYNPSYSVPVVTATHEDLGRKVEPATIPQEMNMYAMGPGPPAPHPPTAPPSAGYPGSTTMPPANGYGRPPYPPTLDNSHATTSAPMGASNVSATPQPPPPPPPPPASLMNFQTLFNTLEQVYTSVPARHIPPANPEGRDQFQEGSLRTMLDSAVESLRLLDPAAAEKYQREHSAAVKENEEATQKDIEEALKEAQVKADAEKASSLPPIDEESEAGDDANGGKRKRMRRDDKGASNEPQQCQTCGVRSSPEWRRGPLGPRTLCNACGLVWIKIMKRRANGLPDEDEEENEENNEGGQSPGNSD